MGYANLDSAGTGKRVSVLYHIIHHGINGFDSLELQRACARIKESLYTLRPGFGRGFDFGDSHHHIQEDWLPLRAEPEGDSPTDDAELLLVKLVEAAVRQVGWVPQDVYQFLARPTTFGMFFMLGAV